MGEEEITLKDLDLKRLSESIINISDNFQKMVDESGLTERALVTLIYDLPGCELNKKHIRWILENLGNLKEVYTKEIVPRANLDKLKR